MKFSPWFRFKRSLQSANQWLLDTPERALAEAYEAALMIKTLEEKHFKGEKIGAESVDYGDTVLAYFKTELQKYLKIIEMRLIEFNASRTVVSLSDFSIPGRRRRMTTYFPPPPETANIYDVEVISGEAPSLPVLEKLKFIDQVTAKYIGTNFNSSGTVSPRPISGKSNLSNSTKTEKVRDKSGASLTPDQGESDSLNAMMPDSRFLPRSLLGTLDRIRNELDPQAEESMLKNFQKSRVKTIVSIRFILLLILIPLLTQQLTKNFLVGPIVDNLRPINSDTIFLNVDMEEDAFIKLKRFEDRLEFEELIGLVPQLGREEKDALLEKKALEIATEYQQQSSGAIKNIFADLLSIVAFGLIIKTNKRDVDIVKSFMDDLVYGLSDSAKAFIIILLTDMFVGFHSPHGWEVLLEGFARHVGLPESREFIFLFIATFPVILDAVFKYWIFRYLNRSSPSAVATYKNMNE